MAEKKETQYAVLKQKLRIDGALSSEISSITWFDARQDARNFARDKNYPKGRAATRIKKWHYHVKPMKRGPRA